MDTIEKKKIGKYEITGILGRGGMGVVYRAEDKRIGRQVAIKTLTENFSGQPEMLERFYREAQAGILQHPNIVIVYDLGDEDGVPFIVMEYVSGEPLDKLISSGRQISIIEKLSIIEQVCLALGYAHHRGVVHRDIKPANVIVQQDGQAKIVDFGIARVQGSSSEGGLTRTGNVIGTIHYIAPERLKGRPFDGRSDIFATGVMLYLLLTGELPFTGEDMAVLQKLVNEPHPPLSTYLTNYPPALDGIIDRSLAKDPEQRYATAEEFASDLHGLAEQLKKGQITELFSDAERLTAEQQFGRAREVLLQLVRIDPQHTGARQLFGIVQQNLARMQRAEQVRQLIAEAEEAVHSSRFTEALGSLDNALQLDPENAELKTRVEEVKEKKRKYDEIGSLITQADSLKERGDLTGALRIAEKALSLDQQDTKVRALYAEISRQAKLAAQKEQIREMLGKAKQELSSRRFTGAIEILREVGKLDPSLPEAETLLQTAVSGQEQERRRKLIEQIQAEIENCLAAENYDRATELLERAVEQLPTESSLLQLKTRVALQTRAYRTRKLIDTTAAKAQEVFLQSPGEALLIVQRALQELPGEERLLALEESLRQRLKAAEIEEVRGRYMREAQGAIDRGQFDKAIETLESYQLEFADAAGVGELLEYAKRELAQQQRRARIAASVTQARELLLQERFDHVIQLLEPAVQETSDPTLSRLLEEARTKREALLRKSEAVLGQIARHRERGQLDEAINLLLALPATSVAGSPQYALLAEIRAEKARKETTASALAAAAQASNLASFQAAIDSLQKVQRAWGDTPELSKAVSGIESRRSQLANETVAKSVEAARAALLENNATAAVEALKSSVEWFEFAGSSQQADWKRLNAEAAKPTTKRATGFVPQVSAPGETKDVAPPRNKLLVPLIAAGVVVLGVIGFEVWHHSQEAAPPPPVVVYKTVPAGPSSSTAPTGTLLIKGSVDKGSPENVQVLVDGAIKGLTQPDGTAKLLLDPGQHSVRFIKPGYSDSAPTSVTIAANAQQTVPFTLTQIVGAPPPPPEAFITIQSAPGASVTLDGAPQPNTDTHGALNLQVKPGSHALGINLSGYQAFNQSLNLKNGDHPTVYATLIPIPKAQPTTPNPVLPVQVAFYASSSTIQQGQSTTLNWQINNATEAQIDNGIGGVGASGQKEVSPSSNTTYVLTAKGNGGTQQQTVNIIVTPKPPPSAQPPTQPQTPDQSALIQQTVNNFVAAYNAHNLGQIQSIWSNITSGQGKALQGLFKNNPESRIADACSSAGPTINGNSASWTCTETSTFKNNGKMESHTLPVHFSFAKKGDNWTIVGRQ